MDGNKYILDIANSMSAIISNDAFWYLYQDEEMLDELNMKEVDELWSKFPEGFYIDDNYTINKNGTVTCKIIPYIKESNDIKWDGENVTKNKKGKRIHILKFKFLSENKCYIKWFDELQNKLLYSGECNVVYFNSNPWCEIISNKYHEKSYIPLSGPSVILYK